MTPVQVFVAAIFDRISQKTIRRNLASNRAIHEAELSMLDVAIHLMREGLGSHRLENARKRRKSVLRKLYVLDHSWVEFELDRAGEVVLAVDDEVHFILKCCSH